MEVSDMTADNNIGRHKRDGSIGSGRCGRIRCCALSTRWRRCTKATSHFVNTQLKEVWGQPYVELLHVNVGAEHARSCIVRHILPPVKDDVIYCQSNVQTIRKSKEVSESTE